MRQRVLPLTHMLLFYALVQAGQRRRHRQAKALRHRRVRAVVAAGQRCLCRATKTTRARTDEREELETPREQ